MMKPFLRAVLLVSLAAVAGCSSDRTASTEVQDDRAPLTGPSNHTLNSPATGPTSAGLSGGTETSDPPEFDPDRGMPAQSGR